MTTRLEPPTRGELCGRWVAVVGPAAVGLLGLLWTTSDRTFPFGAVHDPLGQGVSLLDDATPVPTGIGFAVGGFLAAITGTALARAEVRGRARLTLAAVGWLVVASCLALVDYRPLLAFVRGVMLLLGAPFGWPEQLSLREFLPTFLPWNVVIQLVVAGIGIGFAVSTLAFLRRTGAWSWSVPAGRSRRIGAWAVTAAILCPSVYAASRWYYFLAPKLGCECTEIRRLADENPGIWVAGAMLATMGMLGGLLCLGLVQRWGEVYPRWVWWRAGRPVAPRTAIIPATMAALMLTTAGAMYVRHYVGVDTGQSVLDSLPMFGLVLWGPAVALATWMYWLRRCRPAPEPVSAAAR